MTVRQELIDLLWFGGDPFAGLNIVRAHRGREDHPYFAAAVNAVLPRITVVLGAWKGDAVVSFAERLRDTGEDGAILAVDTWLGAWDHWLQQAWFEQLDFVSGYPTLYQTFTSNILAHGLEEYVVPLPIDINNACQLLRRHKLSIDLLYVDGARDFGSVMADLNQWWPMLADNGLLIGDDYYPSGDNWADVRAAFQLFFRTDKIENQVGKCRVRKTPAAGGPLLLR